MKKSKRTLIVAEIALSHNGSLFQAKNLIKKCKEAGADYVKFQTHLAEHESSLDETFRPGFKFKEKNRYEYWKNRQFSLSQWKSIYAYSKKEKIEFLSSPFSVEAVRLLKKVGLKTWKISSGEFFSESVLEEVMKTNNTIILSTGMAKLSEIKKIIKKIKKNKNDLIVLQCTSKYPTKLNEVGLNIAQLLKNKFKVKNGISDHSGTIFPSLEAIRLKFDLIEVHVEEKNKLEGPDTKSSINFEELKILTKANNAYKLLKTRLNKDKSVKSISKNKLLFTKSICTKVNVTKGQKITIKNICFKKPGFGIPERKINEILNFKFNKDIKKNKIVFWKDVRKNEKNMYSYK